MIFAMTNKLKSEWTRTRILWWGSQKIWNSQKRIWHRLKGAKKVQQVQNFQRNFREDIQQLIKLERDLNDIQKGTKTIEHLPQTLLECYQQLDCPWNNKSPRYPFDRKRHAYRSNSSKTTNTPRRFIWCSYIRRI